MNELNKAIDDAKKIMIAGHVRPDGDCIGACVALQRYIKRFYPEKNLCVYIETVPEVFQFMDDKKDIFSNSVRDSNRCRIDGTYRASSYLHHKSA